MNDRNVKVLILEDEPMILMDLSFALEDAGYAAVTSSSCEEAIEAIGRERIDAAILDVNLGGGETCEPAAELLKERGIPFFLHTGDLDRHGELVERIGAPIVSKPASSERIAEMVSKLLEPA